PLLIEGSAPQIGNGANGPDAGGGVIPLDGGGGGGTGVTTGGAVTGTGDPGGTTTGGNPTSGGQTTTTTTTPPSDFSTLMSLYQALFGPLLGVAPQAVQPQTGTEIVVPGSQASPGGSGLGMIVVLFILGIVGYVVYDKWIKKAV